MPVRGALVSMTAPPAVRCPQDVAADVAALTAPLGDAAHPVLGLPDHAEPWPPEPPPSPARLARRAARGLPRARRRRARHRGGDRQPGAPRARGGAARRRLRGGRRPAPPAGAGAPRVALALEAARTRGRSPPPRRARPRAARRAHVDRSRRRGDGAPGSRARTEPVLLRRATSAPRRGARRRGARAPRTATRPAGHRRHPAPRRRGAAAPRAQRPERAPYGRVRARDEAAPRSTTPSAGSRRTRDELRATAARLATALDRRGLDPDTVRFVDSRLRTVVDRARRRPPAPILPLLRLVDADQRPGREELRVLAAALTAEPDSDDLAALGATVARRPGQPVATAFDLDRASTEIAAAFDPTITRPTMVDRVLGGILDAVGCRRRRPDGAGGADARSRPAGVAVPARQRARVAVARRGHAARGHRRRPDHEPRFRRRVPARAERTGRRRAALPQLPADPRVGRRCGRSGIAPTPRRETSTTTSSTSAAGPPTRAFGAASHQTPSASSADLVVLFNTPLFREYPGTLVYLVPALRKRRRNARLGDSPQLRFPPVPRVPGTDLARPDVLRLRPRPGARRRAVGRAGRDGERAALLQRSARGRARQATAPTSPVTPSARRGAC